MRKYFAIAKAEWLDALQTRGEIFIWLFLETLPIFIMASLWSTNKSSIPNFSTNQLVTYYVAILITSRLTGHYFDEGMQKEIKEGTLSRFLVKPIKFPLANIPQNLGGKAFNTIFLLTPVLVIIISIFRNQLIIPSPQILFLFLLSLVPAFFIQYSISVLVSSVAFYWEQAYSIVHIKWMMESMIGGYMLPLSLYPDWARLITDFFPFKYVFFVPAAIFTQRFNFSEIGLNILYSTLWAIILFYIGDVIWKRGVKEYSSVGG